MQKKVTVTATHNSYPYHSMYKDNRNRKCESQRPLSLYAFAL